MKDKNKEKMTEKEAYAPQQEERGETERKHQLVCTFIFHTKH
jgi:hypothetical protein